MYLDKESSSKFSNISAHLLFQIISKTPQFLVVIQGIHRYIDSNRTSQNDSVFDVKTNSEDFEINLYGFDWNHIKWTLSLIQRLFTKVFKFFKSGQSHTNNKCSLTRVCILWKDFIRSS